MPSLLEGVFSCYFLLFFFLLLIFIYLFIFYFIILYWFCHTLTWIRHGCTCVPHPQLPSHFPPHSIPLGHPSAPAPGLVIHFTYENLHVSMPFSHIILPSPSPTESERLSYMSVSLLLSLIQGYHYHLSKFYICSLVYCIGVFFFSWLTSLCIIGSSSIHHLIRTDSNVFF